MTATEERLPSSHTQYLQEIGPFTAEPNWGRDINEVMIALVPGIKTMMFPPDRYADDRPEDRPAAVDAYLVQFNPHARPDANMLRDILALKGRRFATAWEVDALMQNHAFRAACEGKDVCSLNAWAWTDLETFSKTAVVRISDSGCDLFEWETCDNHFWYIVIKI